jgi:hypothetical protein
MLAEQIFEGSDIWRHLNIDLKEQIQKIVHKFPEYGYRRVTTELRNQGYVVNHKRVLRIMREGDLLCLL